MRRKAALEAVEKTVEEAAKELGGTQPRMRVRMQGRKKTQKTQKMQKTPGRKWEKEER